MAELYNAGEVTEKVRTRALIAVGVLWGWAIITVVVFMVRSMTATPDTRPDVTLFTTTYGPLIVLATVVLPAFIAAWVARQKREGRNVIHAAPGVGAGHTVKFTDHLYRALVLPLVEFVGRLGWSLVLILAIVLTYRICDSIWGVFAYPFYLGELGYTGDEVAFASKFFGVFAIIFGLALGGWIITVFGRMFTLTLGAALAAATNLLYADLAVGGPAMQAASDAIGFSALIGWMAPFGGEGLPRLTFTIFWENLAIGIAGAAYIAWLSSIVAKKYAAVQYALLASLTLLVGTLGRGALGEMIEVKGYHYVFIFTALIGIVAVVLCVLEWIRETRAGAKSGVVQPDPQIAAE